MVTYDDWWWLMAINVPPANNLHCHWWWIFQPAIFDYQRLWWMDNDGYPLAMIYRLQWTMVMEIVIFSSHKMVILHSYGTIYLRVILIFNDWNSIKAHLSQSFTVTKLLFQWILAQFPMVAGDNSNFCWHPFFCWSLRCKPLIHSHVHRCSCHV